MKTLIFTDAHNAKPKLYEQLLEEIKNHEIQEVKFLGDIDQVAGYRAFFSLRRELREKNVDFEYIKGNHDQAWLEYAQGLEERIVGNVEVDPSIKTPEYIHHLKDLNEALIRDKIWYIHAFPLGKIYSGPLGQKQIEGDRRLKHPKLWHYSFGTDKTVGEGFNAYDPEIIQSNFEYMKNNNVNYMIKGHEHISKIWTLEEQSNNIISELIQTNSKKIVNSPAIIQVGSFIDGKYLIINKEENSKELHLEFNQIEN